MKKHLLRAFFTALLLQPVLAKAVIPYGYWKVAVRFSTKPSTTWEMNLDIRKTAAGCEALLDIPSLMMAWEPVPVEIKHTRAIITLPFGLGKFDLSVKGDSICAGNENFTLRGIPAPGLEYRVKAVEWKNDSATLRGSIYYPKHADPGKKFPLVIVTHGASTGTRRKWEYRSWAKIFLQKGFAVLLYDRRGSGESTGNFQESTLDDLSEDLVRGMQCCCTQSMIDTSVIAIAGGSQAAYIGFMAAAQRPEIKFMILTAPSAVSMDQQEIHNVLYYMRHEKESPENIDTALAYMRLYFHYAATGLSWDRLEQMARRAETTKWGGYLDQPLKENDLYWWRHNYNIYRPEKILPVTRIPLLLLYGSDDYIVPPQENTGLMKYYLDRAKNERYEIHVLDGASHSMEVGSFTDTKGIFHWPQKHDLFFQIIDRWMKQLGYP